MDENNLPILHIRRTKKHPLPQQGDSLPSLTIQRKRKRSHKEPEQRKKNMYIPCAHCGKVNPVDYYVGMDVQAELHSLYCIGCGKKLYSLDDEDTDEWDKEYEEDADEKEDYRDKPPAFVSSPASAPRYQEQERYQPPQGQSRLGRDIQTGQYVDVPQASRREGLYIIGITGTGKTGLIENLIIQDIKQGRGVCLLDPHGDLTNAVLARIPDRREKDVIYLDITDYHYPFGVNLFACSDLANPIEVQKIVDQIMHVFEKLLGVSRDTPLILQYLRNCTYTLIANPGYTMADIPLLLTDKNCRQQLVANVKRLQTRLFWQQYEQMKPGDQLEQIASIQRRVDDFLQDLILPIVGQAKTTVDIRQVMDDGKILLVKLSAQLDSVTSLIGSVLVALFLNAAYARPANKRRQFNLYADEFQRFATDDFATLLTEARKFGIATTIAHQARYQPGMTDGIRATSLSAKNLVVFKVNSQDADELAGEFDITPPPAKIEVRRPQQHRRIEEQVEVEVEEEIEEISHTPFDHLERGSHRSAKVREAVQTIKRPTYFPLTPDMPTEPLAVYLTVFPEHRGENHNPLIGSEYFNALLVDVMEGRLSLRTKALAVRIFPIVQSLAPYIKWLGSGAVNATWWYAFEDLPSHIGTLISKGYMTKEDYEKYTRGLRREGEEPEVYKRLFALIWGLVSGQGQLDRLKQDLADAISDVFVLHIGGDLYHYYSKRVYEIEEFKDSLYKLGKAEKEIERLHSQVKESVSKATQIITEWTPLIVNGVVTYVSHWLTLCEELAKEENHIKVGTGQKRMVKRIQPHITYLTDESEKVTVQRSYPEMLKVVASELVNQDNYIARVQYINADQRRVECTIRTLDPKQDSDTKPLFGQALDDRIARIQAHNRTPSTAGALPYCRSRQDVEAEIRQRQELCSKHSEPPEEPPISRHPPR